MTKAFAHTVKRLIDEEKVHTGDTVSYVGDAQGRWGVIQANGKLRFNGKEYSTPSVWLVDIGVIRSRSRFSYEKLLVKLQDGSTTSYNKLSVMSTRRSTRHATSGGTETSLSDSSVGTGTETTINDSSMENDTEPPVNDPTAENTIEPPAIPISFDLSFDGHGHHDAYTGIFLQEMYDLLALARIMLRDGLLDQDLFDRLVSGVGKFDSRALAAIKLMARQLPEEAVFLINPSLTNR